MLHIAAICATIVPLCALLAASGALADKIPDRWVRRFEGAKKQPARCNGQAAHEKTVRRHYTA